MSEWAGPADRGYVTRGATDPYTHQVLILDSVCGSLARWVNDDDIWTHEVSALATIYHEAEHVKGVRSERIATCRGAQYASLVAVRRFPDVRAQVIKLLYHALEAKRPPAYRMNGTCAVLV